MNGVSCPYCDKFAELVDSQAIYPAWRARDAGTGKHFVCWGCKAWTTAKYTRNTWRERTGYEPVGQLANAELRHWRKMAYGAFNALWRTVYARHMQRYPDGRYKQYDIKSMIYHTVYLAMGWNQRQKGGIESLGLEDCKRVVQHCNMEDHHGY